MLVWNSSAQARVSSADLLADRAGGLGQAAPARTPPRGRSDPVAPGDLGRGPRELQLLQPALDRLLGGHVAHPRRREPEELVHGHGAGRAGAAARSPTRSRPCRCWRPRTAWRRPPWRGGSPGSAARATTGPSPLLAQVPLAARMPSSTTHWYTASSDAIRSPSAHDSIGNRPGSRSACARRRAARSGAAVAVVAATGVVAADAGFAVGAWPTLLVVRPRRHPQPSLVWHPTYARLGTMAPSPTSHAPTGPAPKRVGADR
jgi:hypothetical protein